MKTQIKRFLAVLLCGISVFQLCAQEDRNKSLITSYLHGWEYSIKAGFNVGGTAPLPLPEEIRSIDGYAPGISIAIEGNATKWLDAAKKMGANRRYSTGKQEYDY